MLRTMAGEQPMTFIVGDAHQRIYRNQAVLSHCGVNVRGRSSHLRSAIVLEKPNGPFAYSKGYPLMT